MLISSILDESEKKGNGGLISLTSLIKGEKIILNFINEHTYGHNLIPKRFTVKIESN